MGLRVLPRWMRTIFALALTQTIEICSANFFLNVSPMAKHITCAKRKHHFAPPAQNIICAHRAQTSFCTCTAGANCLSSEKFRKNTGLLFSPNVI
jgi:hypothetical protein